MQEENKQQNPSINPPISNSAGIPNEDFKYLPARAFWLFFWPYLIIFIIIFLFSILTLFFAPILLIIPIIYIFATYYFANLQYKNYFYAFTDTGLRIHKGVIYKTVNTIPYDRIQNIDFLQDIPHRILKLRTLVISTAGGAGSGYSWGVRLLGVEIDESEKIQQELLRRSHGSENGL